MKRSNHSNMPTILKLSLRYQAAFMLTHKVFLLLKSDENSKRYGDLKVTSSSLQFHSSVVSKHYLTASSRFRPSTQTVDL